MTDRDPRSSVNRKTSLTCAYRRTFGQIILEKETYVLTAHTRDGGGLPLVWAGRIFPGHRGLGAGKGKQMDANGNANGNETVFTMEATPIKYGRGAAEEEGWEVRRLRKIGRAACRER